MHLEWETRPRTQTNKSHSIADPDTQKAGIGIRVPGQAGLS